MNTDPDINEIPLLSPTETKVFRILCRHPLGCMEIEKLFKAVRCTELAFRLARRRLFELGLAQYGPIDHIELTPEARATLACR